MSITKMKDRQLQDLHSQLSMELGILARQLNRINSQITELDVQLDDIEMEMETREAKKQGKLN